MFCPLIRTKEEPIQLELYGTVTLQTFLSATKDCDGIWPFINAVDDGGRPKVTFNYDFCQVLGCVPTWEGLHQFPDGTRRLAGYVKMSDGVRTVSRRKVMELQTNQTATKVFNAILTQFCIRLPCFLDEDSH